MSEEGFFGLGSIFDINDDEDDRQESIENSPESKNVRRKEYNNVNDRNTLDYIIKTQVPDSQTKEDNESSISDKLKALPTFSDIFDSNALGIDEDPEPIESNIYVEEPENDRYSSLPDHETTKEFRRNVPKSSPLDFLTDDSDDADFNEDSSNFASYQESDVDNGKIEEKYSDDEFSPYPSNIIDLLNQTPDYNDSPVESNRLNEENVNHLDSDKSGNPFLKRFERRQVMSHYDDEFEKRSMENDQKLHNDYGFPEAYYSAPESYHEDYLQRMQPSSEISIPRGISQSFGGLQHVSQQGLQPGNGIILDMNSYYDRYTQYNENMKNDLHGHLSHIDGVDDDEELFCNDLIKEKGTCLIEELKKIEDQAKQNVINLMLDGEWHNEKELIRVAKQARYIGTVSFGMMMLSFCEIVDKRFLMKKIMAETGEPQYKINDNFVGLAITKSSLEFN